MTTLKDSLRPVIDRIRGSIPGVMGLRVHTVHIVTVSWSGSAVGLGTATATYDRILNAGFNPKVTQISSQDVARSNGFYEAGDIRIEPVTPEHAFGGTATSRLDPVFSPPREIFYLIQGQGIPSSGVWAFKVSSSEFKPFRYGMVVRQTASVPNVALPT